MFILWSIAFILALAVAFFIEFPDVVVGIYKRRYRNEWVRIGREFRRKGLSHLELKAEADWLQRYFDKGYYGKDR